MRPRIYARDTGRAVEPDDRGIYRLGAEGRWFVEGDPATIEAIDRSLGAVSAPIGRAVLELRFGNGVGWYDAGPLGHLDVRTGKWGEADYTSLLARLTEVTSGLPFSAGASAALRYERTVMGSDDVVYHAFAHLRHLIGSPLRPETRLVGPLSSVLARPHHRNGRRRQVVPTALASRSDARTLIDVASARWPMRRALGIDLPTALGGRLPMYVEESTLDVDIDTPENRFVKHLLGLCADVVSRVSEAARRRHRPLPRIAAQCEHIDGVLRPLRRHRLWSDVGRMTHFPSASTVLQRRADYRALFTIYNALRLGARPLVGPDQMLAFLEAKDIALLYEMWACIAVLRAVTAALGPPATLAGPRRSVFDLTMSWGLHARWPDGTRLDYNSTWTRAGSDGRRSYSVMLRPDIVLEIRRGSVRARHVFDAKFKLGSPDRLDDPGDAGDTTGARATFVRADIHKMHAYRDALAGVRSAWVLYPGAVMRFFPVDGLEVRAPSGLVGEIAGVGALPLPADGPGAALRETIAQIVRPSPC